MENSPPNPWGSCFDATAHNMLANRGTKGLTVCHGIGIATRPGQEGMRVAHAWLEFDHPECRAAFDCIWLKAVPAEKYRRDLNVSYAVEYTPEEYMRLWTLHDLPGPWDAKVIEHTKDSLSLFA